MVVCWLLQDLLCAVLLSADHEGPSRVELGTSCLQHPAAHSASHNHHSCPCLSQCCSAAAFAAPAVAAVLQFATEAALTILRIDDLIKLDAPQDEGGEE